MRARMLALTGLLIATLIGAADANAQAIGEYTSRSLGYTITWDDSWQSNRLETTDTSDILSLTDEHSEVLFIGRNDGTEAEQAVADMIDLLRANGRFRDVETLDDCPAGDREIESVASCVRFQRIDDHGELVAETALLEAWDLGNGIRLLMVASAPTDRFDAYLPKWAAFGVAPAGESATPVGSPVAAVMEMQPR